MFDRLNEGLTDEDNKTLAAAAVILRRHARALHGRHGRCEGTPDDLRRADQCEYAGLVIEDLRKSLRETA